MLSKKPLLAFVAYCADITLGEIDALFTGNGLTLLNEDFERHEWAWTGGSDGTELPNTCRPST